MNVDIGAPGLRPRQIRDPNVEISVTFLEFRSFIY